MCLNCLHCILDLTNGSLNGGPPGGGSLVLGRGPSPSLEINTAIPSLNGATFQSLSGSPSPILSQPGKPLCMEMCCRVCGVSL